jgi:hypothetical protein
MGTEWWLAGRLIRRMDQGSVPVDDNGLMVTSHLHDVHFYPPFKVRDIDILVDVASGRSLLDVVGLWLDLQELLGRKVDLLTEGGVNIHLRDRILAEARPL